MEFPTSRERLNREERKSTLRRGWRLTRGRQDGFLVGSEPSRAHCLLLLQSNREKTSSRGLGVPWDLMHPCVYALPRKKG